MNAKKLYREIGNIDENLIEEAANAHSIKTRTRKAYAWVTAAAACLVVAIVIGATSFLGGDSLHINEMQGIMNADMKYEEPAREQQLTYKEVFQYLGIDELPTTLPGRLHRLDTDTFSLLYDQQESVYNDVFNFEYQNDDYSSLLKVSLSKTNVETGLGFYKGAKESEIAGTKMIIGRFEEQGLDDMFITYAAQFERNGVFYTIVAENVEENDFVNVVKKILE